MFKQRSYGLASHKVSSGDQAMRLKGTIQRLYRMILLPAIRSAATPCFRLAVKIAATTGVLAPAVGRSADGPEHFTIVHLSNHVGDTVMLLPMVDALRAAHPAAFIECVVQSPIAQFLCLTPNLDRVHEFELGHSRTVNPWLELHRAYKIICAVCVRRPASFRAGVAVSAI